MSERIDKFQFNPFLDGPSEFLAKTLAEQFSTLKPWSEIFGDAVDNYKRMDYGIRNLPALRIYINQYTKEHESWFEVGDVMMDVIWPPNIRRPETEQLPSTIASAIIQQLRSHTFFEDLMIPKVPGLNELGKIVHVNKALGFEWQDDIIPLTELTVNFRLDLRQWDLYLEAQDRTVDEPFDRTLADLQLIAAQIQAMRDDGTQELLILSNQTV